MLKIFIILFNVLIICLKPFYFLVYMWIFFLEYFFFLAYLYDMWRNYDDYFDICIEEIDVSNCSLPSLWMEYCRLNAFARLYVLLSKKKFGLYKLIWWIFVYILGLPIRFIRLSYFFIKNKKGFLEGLEILYYREFYQLKDRKIEIYNRKILLNCYTIGRVLSSICTKHLDQKHLFFFLKEIKNAVSEFNEYESQSENLTKFGYGTLENDKGVKLIVPHYYHKEESATIHATSNTFFKLDAKQRIDLPMPDLIKRGAKNPGTVITKEVDRIVDTGKYKMVCTYQLNSIIFNHLDIFKMKDGEIEYMYNKNYTFEYIMQNYFHKVDHNLVKEFRNNLYNLVFINSTEEDLIYEIKTFMEKDVP